MSEQSCVDRGEVESSSVQIFQDTHLDSCVSAGNKTDNANFAHASSVNTTTDNFSLKYYEEIKNYLLSKNFPDTNYKILLKKRAKHYSIKEGELYYGDKVVLKTKAEQMKMLQESHVEEKTGIHLGVKKMSQIINSKCFWRGQYIDIANFVRQCSKCTEVSELCSRNNCKLDLVNEDSELDCTQIWQKIEVYVHGPFINEHGESVYISAVVDTVSDYILVKCLSENNVPSHLARFLLEVFCMFGIVKCFLSRTCEKYLEDVREELKSKAYLFQKMNMMLHSSLEDLVSVTPDGEEKCSWILPHLENFTNNHMPFGEIDLYVFILKLNAKINQSSPFMKMFNRLPFMPSEEDKENENINTGSTKKGNYGRRVLRSSVLQCRHCQEAFTSKISFRIHQRSHTDEARRRGLLEGQVKYSGERERKIFRRPLLRHKYLALRRRSSFSSENSLQASLTDKTSSLQVPERRRAELRASTVEAIRCLLASSGPKRKRRGKYKKFPLEVQDQMAQYAIENGNLMAVQHFSDKLGVIVSESTIRNIVKCYQNFTPDVRREIGKYASLYGLEAAATHFSAKLGRELKFGLIRKFKNQYLSQNSKTNVSNNKEVSNELLEDNSNERVHSKDIASYSLDMKDKIGQYACDHTVSVTMDFFSKKYNLSLTEYAVRRFKKEYQHKQRSIALQVRVSQAGNHQQTTDQDQQQQQQEHHQLLQQEPQSLEQHQPQSQPQIIPLPVDEQQVPAHGHLLIHPQHQPQLSLFNNTLQEDHPNLDLHEKHQDLSCNPQHSEGLQHDSLSMGSSVALLPFQHQPNTNSPHLHEGPIQSSSQTIDILQSSLNLLNNPQMNNPTTIIYNPSYQLTSTSNIPSNQIIPINQQQNPQITFQTANQCTDSNVQPTAPLTFRPQDVPISASVIINQNVSTIQDFPNNQIYPAFSQPPPIQSNVLTVADHSMALTQSASQVPSMSQERQALSSSGLPTSIAVAVAPVPEQHFQSNTCQPAVVVSQSVSQPILISHTQTLLQHIIDSQAHLNHCSAPVTQHLMGEIHTRQTTSQSYPSVVEQEPHSQVFPHKLNCSLPQEQFDASSLLGGRDSINVELSGNNSKSVKSNVEFDSLPELNEVETRNVPETELLSTTHGVEGKELCEQRVTVEAPESSEREYNTAQICPRTEGPKDIYSPRQPSAEKTRKMKQTKRGGRKEGGKVVAKSTEQKRGTYATYSPEIRAEMGKYAAEYGSQKACDFFRTTHGFNVAESTMRGLRDKYMQKRAMCVDEGNEVTSLGYAPRGRPMRLGQYDEVVQECIKDLVKSGEKITSFLAIATAKHVLMQYEPRLLEENGGKIRLNVTWAKSFLKRSGIRN